MIKKNKKKSITVKNYKTKKINKKFRVQGWVEKVTEWLARTKRRESLVGRLFALGVLRSLGVVRSSARGRSNWSFSFTAE